MARKFEFRVEQTIIRSAGKTTAITVTIDDKEVDINVPEEVKAYFNSQFVRETQQPSRGRNTPRSCRLSGRHIRPGERPARQSRTLLERATSPEDDACALEEKRLCSCPPGKGSLPKRPSGGH